MKMKMILPLTVVFCLIFLSTQQISAASINIKVGHDMAEKAPIRKLH